MGQLHIGKKSKVQEMKSSFVKKKEHHFVQDNSQLLASQNRVSELEFQLSVASMPHAPIAALEPQIITKEVIKYVELPAKETIKYVDRVVEQRVEVPVERIVETVRHIERLVEVPKAVYTTVKFVPKWAYGLIGLETLAIILLVIKLF